MSVFLLKQIASHYVNKDTPVVSTNPSKAFHRSNLNLVSC